MEFDLFDTTSDDVLKDERISVQKKETTIELRRIAYWDSEKEKVLEFLNNHFELEPDKIASIYKHRWQIETSLKGSNRNFR
ncbi:transposase [Salegentibacter sp. 24]|uniref:transposase n=1 Tax=Salegentibacter sp. 24 TaxID=2183986 RepID=UPI0014150F88|nr:transposase [Salegentibacter sp. 24]